MKRARLAIAAVFLFAAAPGPDAFCSALVRQQEWTAAVSVCRSSWASAHRPDTGVALARALLQTRELEPALEVAARLAAPDAAWVRASVATARRDHETALREFTDAARGHRASSQAAALARDELGRAGAAWKLNRLSEALEAQAAARAAAADSGEPRLTVYVALAGADIFRVSGRTDEAERALDEAEHAARQLSEKKELAWVLLKKGIWFNDAGLLSLARPALESARDLASQLRPPRTEIVQSAELNLAFVARHRDPGGSEALEHVEAAVRAGSSGMDVELARGLARAGRDLAAARADLERADALEKSGQWEWNVPYELGRLCERAADLACADAAYRRSIEAVVKLRATAGTLEPSIVAAHRQPFLARLGLLAAAARWDEALELLAALDSASMLRSVAAARELAPSGSFGAASPSPPGTPPAPSPITGAALRAAWRGRHLVILAPSETALWRLIVSNGTVTGSRVGDARALEAAALKLGRRPLDPAALTLLTSALLTGAPPGPLDVLLIGPIARLPLGALASDGAPPLARVLGIRPRAAQHTGSRGDPVVLGDPRSDLPAARAEALDVAAALGVKPSLGAAATAERLRAAASAAVLHLATHADATGGSVLHLADGTLSAEAIASLPSTAGLVVLSSCASGASDYDEGQTSLAAAFLSAGALSVVATMQSVDDAAASEVMRSFYRLGGAQTPIDALAQTHREVAAALPFVVYRAPPEPAAEAVTAREPAPP